MIQKNHYLHILTRKTWINLKLTIPCTPQKKKFFSFTFVKMAIFKLKQQLTKKVFTSRFFMVQLTRIGY